MEFPDKTNNEVVALSREANRLLEDDKFEAAIEKWNQAIALLPTPRTNWTICKWISTYIGDAMYEKQRYPTAKASFLYALNSPGGIECGYLHYRVGQCEMKLGNPASGADYLAIAYRLDGGTMFQNDEEGQAHLSLLRDQALIR